MTLFRRCLLASLMVLTLATSFAMVSPAKADFLVPSNHSGGVRMWYTREHQTDFYYPPTGQTWHSGFTYNYWNDAFGTCVSMQGYNEGMADVQAMINQGWQIMGSPSDYQIALGSW